MTSAGARAIVSVPEAQQERLRLASSWFRELQQLICDRFQRLEHAHAGSTPAATVETTETRRHQETGEDGGGGVMARIRHGAVFEKAGVNCSEVSGTLDERARGSLSSTRQLAGLDRDPRFWASGVSVVCHMQNPLVPAVHMNTRMFWTPGRWWFGGGTDLNPCIEFPEDNDHFHNELRSCCERLGQGRYEQFRDWADRYFFVRHRNRPRGAGGVFFDDLNSGDWDRDFEFVKDLGRTFLDAWIPIVERRQPTPWTDEDRKVQLAHRGTYVEFNLIYDRGTRFGLETGHDPDAVLMSLPPLASWP